jgi:hypothetical protein
MISPQGYYHVYFPISGLLPPLYLGRTLPYVNPVGCPGDPPFFMAFDRAGYEISAFGVNPEVDRFIV